MRKLPNGISNYEDIVAEDMIYVDKTMYIEKLEDLADNTVMFLRPRKFGKTLFTSTLECYYDKNKKDKFEELFGKTYIGKNPTQNRNRYCILKFDFSSISVNGVQEVIDEFRKQVDIGINKFASDYKLDFYNDPEQSTEGILDSIFNAFYIQKPDEQIYVIIDQYDNFAEELLNFKLNELEELIKKVRKIRNWYAILKKGTETVVNRIFITGTIPINLDGLTSGFNIGEDLTKNIDFNDMIGFNKEDVEYIMTELEISKEKQSELLPIIKKNYDGYIFSDEIEDEIENEKISNYKLYNPNMTLYFFYEYKRKKDIPKKLVEINILSDYRKIEAFMELCQNMNKIELLEKIVAEEPIESGLTEKFNAEIEFREKELISLLFYMGYLTIVKKGFGICSFKIPNEVIRKTYKEYYSKHKNK